MKEKTHFADDDPMARIAALEAESAALRFGHRLQNGYAPGDYTCLCRSCGQSFIGDKRAVTCLSCADAAINAAIAAIGEAKPASAEVKSVPDGWQLVPKKITSEMIDAMCQQLGFSGAAVSSAYYDALAASPTPAQHPRQESEIAAEALEEAAEKQEPVAWALEIYDFAEIVTDKEVYTEQVKGNAIPLYTHPAPTQPNSEQAKIGCIGHDGECCKDREQVYLDAARYRYMRNNAQFQFRNGPGLYWYLPRNMSGDKGEQLDAAIDAAMKIGAGGTAMKGKDE